jgi:hypothetical protein
MDILCAAAVDKRGEVANETNLENWSIDCKTIIITTITAYQIPQPHQD